MARKISGIPAAEFLEDCIGRNDKQIERWKPATAWDAANQRPLRYMKKRRTEIMKAADRAKNREKEEAIRDRRNQMPEIE